MKRNLLCGKIRLRDISKISFMFECEEGWRINIILAPPKMESSRHNNL